MQLTYCYSLSSLRATTLEELEQTGDFVAPRGKTVMCPRITVRTLQTCAHSKKRKANLDPDSILLVVPITCNQTVN